MLEIYELLNNIIKTYDGYTLKGIGSDDDIGDKSCINNNNNKDISSKKRLNKNERINQVKEFLIVNNIDRNNKKDMIQSKKIIQLNIT